MPEIELMAMDQPIIVYDHEEKKDKRGFKKANPLDVLRAKREWEEKYAGKEGEKIKIDFSGFQQNKTPNV